MKLILTQLLILVTVFCSAQSITGIWRGHFVQNTFHLRSGQFVEDKYRYEIQINSLPSGAIEGVTYSYKTTSFYGKASLQGIYSKKGKTLLIKELKMLELKISDQSTACLMTCYLDYSKSDDGTKETLTGTYTSTNQSNGSQCGSGTVYLERVYTTEFDKEDFLVKKAIPKHKLPPTLVPKASAKQNLIKPGAEDFVIAGEVKKDTNKAPKEDSTQDKPLAENNTLTPKDTSVPVPIPDVLLKRENVLTQTFIVDSEDATVEFFDNGQIDGDTISVYHNNVRVVDSKRLTYAPITMKAHIEKDKPNYEFIVVAENLGAVPPNTALVIINSGSKHYEINIASDEQRNAKIVLQYKKPPEKKK